MSAAPAIDLRLLGSTGAVRNASKSSGIFYVTGHGVPQNLVEQAIAYQNSLLSLSRRPSEGLAIGAIDRFDSAVACAGQRIAAVLAMSLGLQYDAIRVKQLAVEGSLMLQRFQLLTADHAYGSTKDDLFTLLVPGGRMGLDVEAGGRWVHLPSRPGALVVVLGPAAHALSNGQYPSVLHRVAFNNRGVQTTLFGNLPPLEHSGAQDAEEHAAAGPAMTSTAALARSNSSASKCSGVASAWVQGQQAGSQKQLAI